MSPQYVGGVGSVEPKLMIVGEAPGVLLRLRGGAGGTPTATVSPTPCGPQPV